MRVPWEITRDMLLAPSEVRRLVQHLRRRVQDSSGTDGSSRPAAILDRVIVEGLLFSGLRCSEFCRLRLADAHLTGRPPTLTVRGGGGRTVFLPRHVARLFEAYRRELRPNAWRGNPAGRDRPDAPLILNERGRAYERTGLYRRVVAVLTAAGLGARASVQLLRHTYGYLAYLRTGGNLLFVQRQLGHAHPMITAVYASLVDEDYASLAESVAAELAAPVSRKPPIRKRAPSNDR